MFCIYSFYTLGGLLVGDASPSGLECSGGAAVETMTEEELVQCLCRKVKFFLKIQNNISYCWL